jgi:hypothetical protein
MIFPQTKERGEEQEDEESEREREREREREGVNGHLLHRGEAHARDAPFHVDNGSVTFIEVSRRVTFIRSPGLLQCIV